MKTILNKLTLLSFVAIFAFAFTACNDVADPLGSDSEFMSETFNQDAFKKGNGNGNGNGNRPFGNALDNGGKIYVCKFVSTPDVNERLKRGNKGLVHVSPNTLRNVGLANFPEVSIGDSWTDRHGNSTVIDPELGARVLGSGDYTEEELRAACEGDFGGEDEEEEEEFDGEEDRSSGGTKKGGR